ncbi:retrovirus-related pol polyprotein from transposon TNT 1-94 [Tanacetum coccineum]
MTKLLTNKLLLKQRLFSLALKDHLDALNSILTDLKNVEVKIDDEDVTLIFLVSLPPSFENFELQKLNPPAYRFRIGVDIEHKKAKEKKGHWKFNCPRLKEKGQVAVVAKDDSGSERDVDWFVAYEEFDDGHVFMALNMTFYLINMSPATAINCKTPIKVLSGKPADYSKLCVFGGPAYYHVSKGKLDLRGEKGIFMGYGYGVEDVHKQAEHVVPGDMDHDVTSPDDQPNSPNLEHEQDRSIAHDRPRRNTKAFSRFGFEDYVAYALPVAEEVESLEPITYREAISSKEFGMWIAAMGEEINSPHKNNTWELVKLPERRKVVGLLEYMNVHDNDASESSQPSWGKMCTSETYIRDLIDFDVTMSTSRGKHVRSAKGYSQKGAYRLHDIFSPVVRHTSIRVLLSLVAHHDLELEQLDVNTAFLHGVTMVFYVLVNYQGLSWKATLQPSVALSTTEAEYIALTEAAKEAIWFKGLIEDLGFPQDKATVFCDSMSAICLAKYQVYHDRTRHIDVRYHFIRTERRIKVKKIDT